jgi:TRAP-type C4-dicarboxylate transport system permease small subunit
MARLSRLYELLLGLMMGLSCLLVLAMMLMIVGDVALRNAGLSGIPWSNEVSEDILYLVTLLTGPWLLRQGQHIRVDILLRAMPPRLAWQMEWLGDIVGLACCLTFAWYGWKVTGSSYVAGSVSIKTLVHPEWWLLAPLPVAFLLFAVEFLFRMHRLANAVRAARTEAVSAS